MDSRTAVLDSPVSTAAFTLAGVQFHYPDGTPALEGVSLEIQPGERVALLGANGSGKSSLLKVMDGLAFAHSGQIAAFGQELSERALSTQAVAQAFRRRVGFVFQNADAQLFSSSVREELAFGPLQLGLDEAEVRQRIADIAALLEMGDLLERPPFRLSAGQKRKVAIGSVLITNPDAILLDEPTSGLDPRSQSWLVGLLRRVHEAGKTLVIATHDLSMAAQVADRAIVLGEDHAVHADGPIRPILENAELLRAVNLIHEHLHWHGDLCHSHAHFHDAEHDHPHPHA